MGYQKYLTSKDETNAIVQTLVLETIEKLHIDSTEIRRELREKYSFLPFSDRVWDMYFLNTFSLAHVKRKDGRPYATHPTRMALLAYLYLDSQSAEEIAVPALLHDYLEETDGISKASVQKMKGMLEAEPLAVKSAILLSEPMIDYEQLGPHPLHPYLKRVSYVLQARNAFRKLPIRELANVSLIDKIDNLHDLGYLDQNHTAERRNEKLSQRVAFFILVLREIGPFADAIFREVLEQAIQSYMSRYDLTSYCTKEVAKLDGLITKFEREIGLMTESYHRQLDVDSNI